MPFHLYCIGDVSYLVIYEVLDTYLGKVFCAMNPHKRFFLCLKIQRGADDCHLMFPHSSARHPTPLGAGCAMGRSRYTNITARTDATLQIKQGIFFKDIFPKSILVKEYISKVTTLPLQDKERVHYSLNRQTPAETPRRGVVLAGDLPYCIRGGGGVALHRTMFGEASWNISLSCLLR